MAKIPERTFPRGCQDKTQKSAVVYRGQQLEMCSSRVFYMGSAEALEEWAGIAIFAVELPEVSFLNSFASQWC